jgi:hypothetical protein
MSFDLRSPVVAFSAAADLLRVSKGALLLRSHERDSFAVWAHRHLDETTRHRLEFPRHALPALIRDLGLESSANESQKIATLTPYLSNRESSMIRSPLLLALPDSDPQALLLILDSPYLTDEQATVVMLLAAVGDPIVDAVNNTAVQQLRSATHHPALSRSEFSQRILGHIQEGGTGGRVVTLNVQPMLSYMTHHHPEVDRFRCFQDLHTLIQRITGTEFLVGPHDPTQRVWIYIPAEAGEDTVLLVAHLSKVIRTKFTVESEVEVLTYHEVELHSTVLETQSQLDDILADVQD